MRYFGIKTPGTIHEPSYIWWISNSEFNSWMAFFTFPSDKGALNPHRTPLDTAIEAYKAIGYKCVELNITEKEDNI